MKDADPARTVSGTSPAASSSAQRTISSNFTLPTLQPGTVLSNRYEILELLGAGGMGAVYKARDCELDRLVAVKIIRPDLGSEPSVLQRFKQELILARTITHKNVIRIYDLGEADGLRFITMEYVEGVDLKTLLHDQCKFSPSEAVRIMVQICRALDASHSEGVIHRDLKPSNVMRDTQDKILVMDFGLAQSREVSGLTQTGVVLGTLAYMAPEQAKGEPVDARTDLYAAGLIFYELLSGKTPYPADSALASLMKRSHERAVPVSQVERTVPRVLSAIVARCLEADPSKRYQSAAELLADLEAFQPSAARVPTTVVAAPSAAVPRLYKWLTVVLASLLVAGAAVLVWKKHQKPLSAQLAPVSILVADFENHTSEPVFDGTLEPAFTVAMEGAPFIISYNRSQAQRLAMKLRPGSTALDENAARLVATREGISTVIGGSITREGDSYRVAVHAVEGATGKTIGTASERARKQDVLVAMGKMAAGIRAALGDKTPESVQLAAAETFTTGSLEAAHEYAIAQSLHFAGKWNEALEHYSKAVQLDPTMGKAYVGMANCYYNSGQVQQAEKYYQMALANVNGMSEREKYRTRGAYYLLVRDTDKAIEQQLQLVKQYPADNAGLANLALAYFFRRDMQKALEEGRKAVAIYPQNVAQRNNVGLYAMYAGDFETAMKEQMTVLELNPSFVLAYVGTALSQLGSGHPEQARQTFEKAATLGQQGASAAAAGLGDVSLYEGRISDAIHVLRDGAAADRGNKNVDGLAIKLVMLAQAELEKGDTAGALRDADEALALSKETGVMFWGARAYIATGRAQKALALARELEKRLQTDPQAYGKLIEGEVRLKEQDPQQALRMFQESRAAADTWMARFDGALAYLDAGAFAEAESELDVCLKRRGEATALFLDESPTYFVLPPVYYYMGRAEEGVKSAGAAEYYKTFLDIKKKSEPDLLVSDARHRLGR